MAETTPLSPSRPVAKSSFASEPKKLPRLPKHARIQKRPLMHPPIPSPHTGKGSKKVVYVSSTTPFMSAVTRTRRLLDLAEKRGAASVASATTQRKKKGDEGKEKELIVPTVAGSEEVVLKATGKAIPKVLDLGVFFQESEKGDYKVRVRTGGVGCVDDIVVDERGDADGAAEAERDEELDETRVRRVPVVEVAVSLK